MLNLVFGLPGTGKSTYVSQQKHHLKIDFGEPFSLNVDDKVKDLVESCLSLQDMKETVYVDSYPPYWQPFVNKLNPRRVVINIAVPTLEDRDFILKRVLDRDGEGDFYRLYKIMIDYWLNDWQSMVEWWKTRGFKVVKTSYYKGLA